MGYTGDNPVENELISSIIDQQFVFFYMWMFGTDSFDFTKSVFSYSSKLFPQGISATLNKYACPMGPPKALSSLPELKNTSSAIKFAVQEGIVCVLICALIANTVV